MSDRRKISPRNVAGVSPPSFADSFNQRSQKASEVELKFLVANSDRIAFRDIEKYFAERNWIRLSRKNVHLLTRQLDTTDKKLFRRGTTLRVRGTCENDNLATVSQADICLKTGKSKDPSGAMRRGEYEARIKNFSEADLSSLLKKYPRKEFPEVHKALHGIRPQDLREFFRIDCYRDRFVVELPEDVTGLKDKRFAAELILDDVAYVIDIPGLKSPLIFYHDLEVECETLFKPCDYDDHPDATRYVSSAMSRHEADSAMAAVKAQILTAAGGRLVENDLSKAERGFMEFDFSLKALRRFLAKNDDGGRSQRALRSAFTLSTRATRNAECEDGVPKLHKYLPRRMGYVLLQRGIASPPRPG